MPTSTNLSIKCGVFILMADDFPIKRRSMLLKSVCLVVTNISFQSNRFHWDETFCPIGCMLILTCGEWMLSYPTMIVSCSFKCSRRARVCDVHSTNDNLNWFNQQTSQLIAMRQVYSERARQSFHIQSNLTIIHPMTVENHVKVKWENGAEVERANLLKLFSTVVTVWRKFCSDV